MIIIPVFCTFATHTPNAPGFDVLSIFLRVWAKISIFSPIKRSLQPGNIFSPEFMLSKYRFRQQPVKI
jgi:hypothetical protein